MTVLEPRRGGGSGLAHRCANCDSVFGTESSIGPDDPEEKDTQCGLIEVLAWDSIMMQRRGGSMSLLPPVSLHKSNATS
jgi:hypothetical protein